MVFNNTLVANIITVIVLFVVIGITFAIIKRVTERDRDTLTLIDGIVNAKQKIIITQNPNITSSKTIRRSDNQDGGVEFSYVVWFLVDDWNYQYGYWKHMFHKGSSNGYPDRCPGVLLHKTENALRIYLNTYKKLNEYIDIPDIPVGPWVHLAIVAKGEVVTIYINGRPTKSRKMSAVPRQNYGDFYISDYKGFSGQLANMVYYNRAITFNEIDNIVKSGPGKKACVDTKNIPPYLNIKWWNKASRKK